MKPCVLRVATISFALSLCAPTPGRAQQPCDPAVLGPDVCGEWKDVELVQLSELVENHRSGSAEP